jgi:Tfp pilus assembly protein PilF
MPTHALALSLALVLSPTQATQTRAPGEVSAFTLALDGAERALAAGELAQARALIQRALERDSKSTRAWAMRARWAEAAGDKDELAYALHSQLRLAIAQKAPKSELAALRARLEGVDPLAKELLGTTAAFVARLEPVANALEKDGRPHSAIRVHKQILALDPERASSQEAIERIASLPDPSLAGDAKPKDLLADVSAEWIREHDAAHATWESRAVLERENYTTHTDAGYEVLVRAAEAMEQMNAFYREFFQYGTEEAGGSVPRIDLNIFRTRDEYLKLGQGPPVEWSGGHFTGNAVETYVDGQGFASMVQTLFHEAAHQFVSLATSAAGWLNEGLASFFEGCRILPNGTVLMNMPASSRLFELASRMEKGWMSTASDGIDPSDPSQSNPEKVPTFRTVLENEYEWGPPWYAPTWGVVYFLYNFQDEVDGRFVYRAAFGEFIDKSGGRTGKGAIENFEEVVLANPSPPLKEVDRAGAPDLALPRSVGELDELWKSWMLALRDEQIGKSERRKPYLRWARCARAAKDDAAAAEHFEKALVATPGDVEMLLEFADFLVERRKNADRATRLALEALRVLEAREPVDEKAVDRVDKLLAKWDPKRETLEKLRADLLGAAQSLATRYFESGLALMALDLSSRLGRDLDSPELFAFYEDVLRKTGKSLAIYELAYDEKGLRGWDTGANDAFRASGPMLDAAFGAYASDAWDYQMLTLERVTAGDFTLEADVLARRAEVTFCGLVFGRKDGSNFHALVFFPGKARQAGAKTAAGTFVDLASFYGGSPKTWRHAPVDAREAGEGESTTGAWHRLRLDVAGENVDAWFDGELVATQRFPSRDVLLGSFGLICGRGKARFKEIRFLARDPRDPAGAIEREARLERVRAEVGVAVDGSYLGQVPPWPRVSRWAQGERASWQEAGSVPQLLVMWSIEQNEIVPIDAWLRDLAARYERVGLAIVAVASPNDAGAIDAYLAQHPFPGAVGVDFREGAGIGDTNKLFFTMRFNLPRLVLLDVDQKVAWEGDPGFPQAEPWKPGGESYLETPLAELVATRKLDRLGPWIAAWKERGVPALERGDLASAWPLLVEAREFDATAVPLAHDVQRKLDAIEALLGDLEGAAANLAAEGREPALRVLVEWSKVAGRELDKRALARLKAWLESANALAWDRALKAIDAQREKAAKDPAAAAALAAKIDALKGPFCAELAAELRAASPADLPRVLASAPDRPARWLATEL